MIQNRTNLPKLDYLLTFSVAAELESFAAAAKDMNVSETAISRKIRLLEAHYNTTLFTRGHRSVQLTDSGRKLLNGITPALQTIASFSDQMVSERLHSTVHMAATNSVASLWLMPRLRGFRAAHESVTISLMSSDLDNECLTPDVDLAILRGEGIWEGYEATLLFGETVFPVCSPDYLAQNPQIADIQTLLTHALVEVSNNHTEWLNWKSWANSVNPNADLVQQSTFVNTYPLAIQAAVDGVGVALGWGHLVDPLIDAGTLVRPLGAEHVRTQSGYYLLQRRGAALRPEHTVVRNWLLQESAERRRYAAE